jgi:putative Mg2+ transporter-C (MgtC) family protein
MPLSLSWKQVALRILLAAIASFVIGYNRDERGKAMGIRSTMLVCLAATLAMLQANLLINTAGKAPSSFIQLDLMRLPLGILSGIGFIGAGAILRKDGLVHGVTTATTIWFVTVLGLLFGGGQLWLAVASTLLAVLILWVLKWVEMRMPTHRTGSLAMQFAESISDEPPAMEEMVRQRFQSSEYVIEGWTVHYCGAKLHSIQCDLKWRIKGQAQPETPEIMRELARHSAISSLIWRG